MPIRVLVYGLGPIGASVARQLVARKGFALVGAVDTDRDKVGLDVAQVIGHERRLKVRVTNDAVGGIRQAKPDVVVTDCLMPLASGLELVARLRTMPGCAATPVVLLTVVTGALMDADENVRVLHKPIDVDEFLSAVRDVTRETAC